MGANTLGKTLRIAFYKDTDFIELRGIYQDKLLIDNNLVTGDYLVYLEETINKKAVKVLDFTNIRLIGKGTSRIPKVDGDILREYIRVNITKYRDYKVKADKTNAHRIICSIINQTGHINEWQYSATGGRTCEANEFFDKPCQDWFTRGLKNIQCHRYIENPNSTKFGSMLVDVEIVAQPISKNMYSIRVKR